MPNAVDWKTLAEQVGTLRDNGEVGDASYARQAIEILLGEEILRQAVDYYISGEPGSELVRYVLWQIHPWSAMNHCYHIYKSDADIEKRRLAIELLRVVADRRAMEWITEFLEEADPQIQMWGAGVLDQLLLSGLISEEEAEESLEKAEKHANPSVREIADSIRERLRRSASE